MFGMRMDQNQSLLSLRSAWAEKVLKGQACHNTAARSSFFHPLAELICRFLTQETRIDQPPLRSEIEPLPIGELCQLALLRGLAGEDGESLGRKILPFCSFPSLWSFEKTYNLKETRIAISLLLRSFGENVDLPIDLDPYFQALEKQLPVWKKPSVADTSFGDLRFGSKIQGAFVNASSKFLDTGVSLGALRSKEISGVEIPAFGPQVHPLNDSKLFGIYQPRSDLKWSSVFAKKDVWLETTPWIEKDVVDVRFYGLTPDFPISFVFYVQAESARIGSELYLPKSLHRYNGLAKSVRFERKGSSLSIENICASKMELIPLAGEGCFWDSDFLLAFEISPHNERASFRFG